MNLTHFSRKVALLATNSRLSIQYRFPRGIPEGKGLMSSISHSERTASVYRSQEIHEVTLSAVNQINPIVRTFVLSSTSPIYFLPGQWLDVHVPGHLKPGGYTLTSSPSLATRPANSSFENGSQQIDFKLHLAIQKALDNPVTEFFWDKSLSKIIGTHLNVRVGGAFTWPPLRPAPSKAVFVAGGVGINPLMSMLRYISELPILERPNNVELLYGFKIPPANGALSSTLSSDHNERRSLPANEVLFLPDLLRMQQDWSADGTESKMKLKLFITGEIGDMDLDQNLVRYAVNGRMTKVDVETALGPDLDEVVTYVCGPPSMTDQLVQVIKEAGVADDRVLCEKWW